MKSHLQQYVHHPDGSITVEGLPGITCELIQQQGRVTGRDIETELGLPKYLEEWEALDALSDPPVLSRRHLQFVVMDEGETKFPGHYRLQPQRVTLPPLCHLEFAHRGFQVGVVHSFLLGFDELRTEIPTLFGVELPQGTEGDYIIGQATLYEGPLPDKAWEALQRRIFSHCCPVIFRQPDEPAGTGRLAEVSLTPDDYPGCPGAKILKTWTT